MMKSGLRLGAVALSSMVALGTAGSAAWGATSATPPSLSQVQADAAAAISMRVNDLNAAVAKVQAAQNLGSESSTLIAALQADVSPLQALGQQIAVDTTVTSAQADASTIFTNFRVFYLVLPAVRLAGASAVTVNGAVANLTSDLGKVNQYVNPSNEATLDPLIASATTDITNAQNAASGIAASVLAVTPAEWNSDHDVLSAAHSAEQGASNDIKSARSVLQQIRADLKSEHAAATTTTTAA
jgi:hypothetical protein